MWAWALCPCTHIHPKLTAKHEINGEWMRASKWDKICSYCWSCNPNWLSLWKKFRVTKSNRIEMSGCDADFFFAGRAKITNNRHAQAGTPQQRGEPRFSHLNFAIGCCCCCFFVFSECLIRFYLHNVQHPMDLDSYFHIHPNPFQSDWSAFFSFPVRIVRACVRVIYLLTLISALNLDGFNATAHFPAITDTWNKNPTHVKKKYMYRRTRAFVYASAFKRIFETHKV